MRLEPGQPQGSDGEHLEDRAGTNEFRPIPEKQTGRWDGECTSLTWFNSKRSTTFGFKIWGFGVPPRLKWSGSAQDQHAKNMDKEKQIQTIRERYKAIIGNSEKMWINRRVEALMMSMYGIEVNRQMRDLWISGRRGMESPHDVEFITCYAKALIERNELKKMAIETVAQLAEA